MTSRNSKSVDNSIEERQNNIVKRRKDGEFVRGASGFRNFLSDDSKFKPEENRYHIIVALNCPWCHRVTLARNILGLADSISMDIAFPNRTIQIIPLALTNGNSPLFGKQA